MTGRMLPFEDWAEKLADTPLGPLVGTIDPEHSRIIVVEDEAGRVVAQSLILTSVHVEALWEAEDVRGDVGVSRALLDALVRELRLHGVTEVLSQATTPEADALMDGAGGRKLPGTCWVLPVGKD